MIYKFLSLIIFGLLLSCSTAEFDKGLIRPLSSKNSRNQTRRTPFFAKFKSGGSTLIYLAAKHEINRDSKTHKLIDQLIGYHEPTGIVIERYLGAGNKFENEKGFCTEKNKKCPESYFTGLIALQRNIKLYGAELSEQELFDKFVSDGGAVKDIIGFFLFRNLVQYKKYHNKPKSLRSYLQKEIKRTKKKLKMNEHKFGVKSFFKWYRKHRKKKFRFQDISYSDIAPYTDGHGIQRLSHQVDLHREIAILNVIESALSENKVLLVVYGSGHYYKHQKVLRKSLGRPEYSR